MRVSSTEVQNNFGKYLILAGKEDIIITKNGTEAARLTAGDSILHQKEIMDNVIKEEAADYHAYDPEGEEHGRKASFEEFLKLTQDNEEARYEYIDGEIYALSSPKTPHQAALAELLGSFYNWFKGKKCRPMVAPYDITLKRNDRDVNVVQPDLMVICDLEEKLGEDGYYKGVPALVLEIVSEGTLKKDLLKKQILYMKTGVKEYWTVFPMYKTVNIYQFKDRKAIGMRSYDTEDDDVAESFIFPGLSVKLTEVFK